jgi:hypothetical protein
LVANGNPASTGALVPQQVEESTDAELGVHVHEVSTTAGNSAAYKKGSTFHDHRQYFGEDPDHNSFQFDDVYADGAMFKHGNLGQGIYVDPGRDVVGVYFSTNGYIPPYGEDKMAGFIRRAAKMLAGG